MNVPLRKGAEVLRFELVYQLGRRSTWLFFGLFLLMTYGQLNGDVISARENGILFNSPIFIARASAGITIFALLVIAAVAGDAATRDIQYRVEPLLHSAPLRSSSYLGGRVAGAFIVVALLVATVPLALLLRSFTVEAELLGPVQPIAYMQSYLFVILPNAFIATALLFALASLVRHTVGSYVGAALLFAGTLFTQMFVGSSLGQWKLATLLDSTGVTALRVMARTWSPADMRARSIVTDASLLSNRLLWIAVACAVVAVAYARFRVAADVGRASWWRRASRQATTPHPPSAPSPLTRGEGLQNRDSRASVTSGERLHSGDSRESVTRGEGLHSGYSRDSVTPGDALEAKRSLSSPLAPPQRGEGGRRPGEGSLHVPRAFNAHTRLRQTLTIARDSLREIGTGWIWIVLPLLALQAVSSLRLDGALGTPLQLTPATLISTIDDPLNTVVLFVLLLAGELVWRERDANMQALFDAAPVPDWVRFIGRVLSSWFVVLVLHTLLLLGTIVFQFQSDGTFELVPYMQVLFGLELAGTLAYALFAFALHVLVNQKHVGLVLGILCSVALPQMLPEFGITHPMLVDSLDPIWRYSDISGFDPFLPQVLWLELYWFVLAMLVAIVARLFLVRGVPPRFMERLRIARRRFTGWTASAAAATCALLLLVGGYVFYNTNVLNAYAAPNEGPRRQAEYERRYGRFEKTAQPELTATKLHVELYPERREAEVRGVHRLVNETAQPIDTIHIAIAPATTTDLDTAAIELDRPARATVLDDDLGHRTYVLAEALQPGHSLQLNWRVRYAPRGFPARDISTDVLANGTFFVMQNWMPSIGFDASRVLTNAGERRLHGLAPRPFVATLEEAKARPTPYGRGKVTLDAIIGTSADQTAVTSGELRRTWTHDGRRYFHYATSTPIGNEYAVFSARYAVRKTRSRDVSVELVHHPEHGLNAQRMLRSMQVSVAQFSDRLGPYPHKVLRMVEYPAAGSSAHASPSLIWYKDQFSLLDPTRHPDGLDLPFAATAHEVAHQWWGGQLRNARAEGIILLSESLAWYSAMGAVEQEYGDAHLQQLLAAMRRAYLDPRSRADVPLIRAIEWFNGYRKGAFAMHALREYVGQDNVDLALRRLLAAHSKPRQPLATSLDLLHQLRQVTPEPLQPLLGDLFERNTFWELKTTKATAQPAANGQWRVSVHVVARKVVVDSEGKETNVPMNDLIEIGAMTGADKALYRAMHRIRSGAQTITITVPGKPARVGIDPRHLLIDVQPDDNLVTL